MVYFCLGRVHDAVPRSKRLLSDETSNIFIYLTGRIFCNLNADNFKWMKLDFHLLIVISNLVCVPYSIKPFSLIYLHVKVCFSF